jgi:hypothetical protein
MRKLLMASAAILGASGSLALAQKAPANPNQGQLAAPYGAGPAANNNNNAWGTANTPSGSAAAGPLSTIYAPNVNAVPAPGTIVIRLNGRVEVDMGAAFSNLSTGVGANAGYKVNPVGIASYMRLYPGFDGTAANGIRYGAAIELRENFGAGGVPANSGSANTSSETVFVRRAFTYLASDKAGVLRFGQADGVLGLFDNCVFTSACWDAGLGNFNGGPNQTLTTQGAFGIPFVWLAQAGAEYGNNKIVYLSPQFFGFDMGVQYAPNMGNAYQNAGLGVGCNQAGPTCINVSSGNDATRWLNQVGVGLRFQQTFGAVDFKTYGFYETAGKEQLTVGAYTAPGLATRAAGGVTTLRYDNLSFYKAGVAVTAMNVTAAVDYIGGAVNGQLSSDRWRADKRVRWRSDLCQRSDRARCRSRLDRYPGRCPPGSCFSASRIRNCLRRQLQARSGRSAGRRVHVHPPPSGWLRLRNRRRCQLPRWHHTWFGHARRPGPELPGLHGAYLVNRLFGETTETAGPFLF